MLQEYFGNDSKKSRRNYLFSQPWITCTALTGHSGCSRIWDWFFLPHSSEGIGYVLENSFDAGLGDSFEEEIVSTSVQLLVFG